MKTDCFYEYDGLDKPAQCRPLSMAFCNSYASPVTSALDDIEYISETFTSPVESPTDTPSPVSSLSILSPTDIGENWSNMSHISRSRTATVVSDLEFEPIVRHPVYYIPSGDVTFLVRNDILINTMSHA